MLNHQRDLAQAWHRLGPGLAQACHRLIPFENLCQGVLFLFKKMMEVLEARFTITIMREALSLQLFIPYNKLLSPIYCMAQGPNGLGLCTRPKWARPMHKAQMGAAYARGPKGRGLCTSHDFGALRVFGLLNKKKSSLINIGFRLSRS
jgi:hypothetical protein